MNLLLLSITILPSILIVIIFALSDKFKEPNKEIFDLNFSFISSGLAIIKKKLNNKLNKKKIIKTRENSIKNKLRKLKHIINEKKY